MNEKSFIRMVDAVVEWAKCNIWIILAVLFVFWGRDGFPTDTGAVLPVLEMGLVVYILMLLVWMRIRGWLDALDKFDLAITEHKTGRGFRSEIKAFQRWRAARKNGG